MKKLLVASHERSGTHFLINSVVLNTCVDVDNKNGIYGFPGIHNPSIDVYHEGPYDDPAQYKENVRKFLLSYTGRFESKVFKSHHKAEFFEDYIEDLKREYHILYIYRNPLDVLTSLYHYYKNCEPGGHHHINFDEDLDEFLFNKRPQDDWYSLSPNTSNIDRLKEHVEGWRNLGVTMVQYEALKLNFVDTINGILNSMDFPPRPFYQKPGLTGVRPRKGEVGDHLNLFSKVQINRLKDFFNV